jgi:RNA-directed DNA polymerase
MSLTTPESVQKLRAALHDKAKKSPDFGFYALYDKVYRTDVLTFAYECCKANGGAAGVDDQTFEDIEAYGTERWLDELTQELKSRTYRPLPVRRVFIPKPGGQQRPLGVPAIRDRTAMMAAVLVLDPIFEADLQPEQYAYRRGRSALDAVRHVHKLINTGHGEIVDADLAGFFDSLPHSELLKSVARRVVDGAMLHLIKMWLKAPVEETDDRGKKHRSTRNRDEGRGTPQGSPISPLLSNIYLTEVDRMLERAKETTRNGKYTYVEYARFADDLVVLIDAHPRNGWLLGAVNKCLREEFAKLQVEINEEKSSIVDLEHAESFGFLGFDFWRLRSMERQVWRAYYTPKMKKRTALLRKLKDVFRRFQSQPLDRVVQLINPILRGWVNYFAVGHSSECFSFIQDWVEKKIRRHMERSRNRRGFGWKRWSRHNLYEDLKLFNGYKVRHWAVPKVLPAR